MAEICTEREALLCWRLTKRSSGGRTKIEQESRGWVAAWCGCVCWGGWSVVSGPEDSVNKVTSTFNTRQDKICNPVGK